MEEGWMMNGRRMDDEWKEDEGVMDEERTNDEWKGG